MLDWKIEEESLQLYAHSDNHGGRTYWITENAWAYLEIVNGTDVVKPMPFLCVEDAKEYAEGLEK